MSPLQSFWVSKPPSVWGGVFRFLVFSIDSIALWAVSLRRRHRDALAEGDHGVSAQRKGARWERRASANGT